MAAITDYDTLVQAVVDVTEDDGTEFANYVPTAIDLAEERLFRECDLPQLEEDSTGFLVADAVLQTKPAGYEFGDSFIVYDGTENIALRKKKTSFLKDYWPDETVTGVPKYYADMTTTTFKVVPAPFSAYAYTIRYTQQPTKLSTTNTINFYVSDIKDALFAAVMVEIAKFTKSWSQVQIWEANYVAAKDSWTIEAMRYRRDGEITPQNPDSPVNSLQKTPSTAS